MKKLSAVKVLMIVVEMSLKTSKNRTDSQNYTRVCDKISLYALTLLMIANGTLRFLRAFVNTNWFDSPAFAEGTNE